MIQIKNEVYIKLASIPVMEYEIGGIIGEKNNIICEVCFDKTRPNYRMGIYKANTEYLNKKIEEWQNNSINFCGIFHTHTDKSKSLSKGDIETIKAIMKDLPNDIDKLYFPLILPKDKLYLYSAKIKNNTVKIYSEKYKITGGEEDEQNRT